MFTDMVLAFVVYGYGEVRPFDCIIVLQSEDMRLLHV